jgi:hypothetical protein
MFGAKRCTLFWREKMTKQMNLSSTAQPRASKIQIEVKPVEQQTISRKAATHLDVDADGGDISNE